MAAFHRACISALLAGFISTSAFAEAVDGVNIAGDWGFVANTGPECTFSGSALLIETEDPTKYDCELTAVQICATEHWQVRQSCSVSRMSGGQVVIVSRIEEFVLGAPEVQHQYRPDNFSLHIKNANLMTGVLVSWGWHTAEFRRQEGSIS